MRSRTRGASGSGPLRRGSAADLLLRANARRAAVVDGRLALAGRDGEARIEARQEALEHGLRLGDGGGRGEVGMTTRSGPTVMIRSGPTTRGHDQLVWAPPLADVVTRRR